jgi:hypothetical protein
MNKRAILELKNFYSDSPLTLCDFVVENGEVTKKSKTKKQSRHVVEIGTELLKVAILEHLELDDDGTPLDEAFLKNYEEVKPTIEEV